MRPLTDNLPDSKQANYKFDTGGCAKSGLVLTCNVGPLAPRAVNTFNVYVAVKGNRGQVTNVASVSSATYDLFGANNSSTRAVLIGVDCGAGETKLAWGSHAWPGAL